MMEFCNFQNCGLSFTLFNKLVWAVIMENGCRETESEREPERVGNRERETFGSLQIHFPFFKNVFAVFSAGMFRIIISVLKLDGKSLWTARAVKRT